MSSQCPNEAAKGEVIYQGDIDDLLIHRLDQLAAASATVHPMDLIDAASAFSQVLLDGEPLVVSSNRRYGLHVRFEVSGKPVVAAGAARLAADSIIPGADWSGENRHLTLAGFLAHPIGTVGKELLTVRDLISYVRNILGGAHLGRLTDRDRKAHELFKLVVRGGGRRSMVCSRRSSCSVRSAESS